MVNVATSGSTGPPRYVRLPKIKVIKNACSSYASFGGGMDGTTLLPRLSLGSSYGLVMQFVTPGVCGIPINVHLLGKIANPLGMDVFPEAPLSLTLSPLQLRSYLLNCRENVPAKLHLFCGGDFLHPSTLNLAFDKIAQVRVFHTYGLTQYGPRVSTRVIDEAVTERSIGEVGIPIPGVSIQADTSTPCADDAKAPTEVVLRTPFGGRAYSGGEIFRSHEDDPAHTGDEGQFGTDRKLRVFGRLDRSGKSVLPLRQLEDFALTELPLIECQAEFTAQDYVVLSLRSRPGYRDQVRRALARWTHHAAERLSLRSDQFMMRLQDRTLPTAKPRAARLASPPHSCVD